MNVKELEKELNGLIHLDHEAASLFESAIERVDHPPIKQQLKAFQDDHRRHVRDLTEALKTAGGKPMVPTGTKGVFIKGFTPVTPVMSTEQVVKAMQGNVNLTSTTYAKAKEKDFGQPVQAIIERHHHDERRHLAFIENALRTRPWDNASTHA